MKPGRVRAALAVWIACLLIFSWLPLVRVVMDGGSYRWGTTHFGVSFGGAGWSPDVWLLVFKTALLGGLLYGTLRAPSRPIRGAVALWSVALAADVVQGVVARPGGLVFHGDTLGIRLNLGWPALLVTCGFAALAIYWAVRDAGDPAPGRRAPWTSADRFGLVLFLALLPVQFVLLRFGEAHGATDAAGVLLTIGSVPLLAWALWPRAGARYAP